MHARHALAIAAILTASCHDAAEDPITGDTPPPSGSITAALRHVAPGFSAPGFDTAPANDPRSPIAGQDGDWSVIGASRTFAASSGRRPS